mmetsp:Transcript_9285/g.15628  ORF Transcript_9285/g.15628 Transcript_9285/m.15628 type:complete len:167 (+) Transcript_9285:1506-2006(+)
MKRNDENYAALRREVGSKVSSGAYLGSEEGEFRFKDIDQLILTTQTKIQAIDSEIKEDGGEPQVEDAIEEDAIEEGEVVLPKPADTEQERENQAGEEEAETIEEPKDNAPEVIEAEKAESQTGEGQQVSEPMEENPPSNSEALPDQNEGLVVEEEKKDEVDIAEAY